MSWCWGLRTVNSVKAMEMIGCCQSPDLGESAHGDSLRLRASPQDGADSLLQTQWGLSVLQDVGQDPQVLAILHNAQLVSKSCLIASIT